MLLIEDSDTKILLCGLTNTMTSPHFTHISRVPQLPSLNSLPLYNTCNILQPCSRATWPHSQFLELCGAGVSCHSLGERSPKSRKYTVQVSVPKLCFSLRPTGREEGKEAFQSRAPSRALSSTSLGLLRVQAHDSL